MIRSLAIVGMFSLLTASVVPVLAQNLPDAPAPHAAQPHSEDGGRGRKTTSSPRNSATPSTEGVPRDTGTQNTPSPGSQSQDTSPQEPPLQEPGKSAAVDNAFPEAESKKAATAARNSDTAPGQGSDRKSSASEENPFPEEKSETAAKAAGSTGASGADADSAGVSSSRKAGSGTVADLPKEGDAAGVPDAKRAAQDAQIGKYYLESGNYKGAYARLREANALSPNDPEVVFRLAEAARKLNHLDEAVTNYKLCLQLDPDGPKAKAARRVLTELDKIASR